MNGTHGHNRPECDRVKNRLMDYFDGEVHDGAALGEIDQHLGQCTACHEDLSALQVIRSKVQSLPRPSAPEGLRARVLAQARAAAATAQAAMSMPSISAAPAWPAPSPTPGDFQRPPIPSMTLPGVRPGAPARRRIKRPVNARRLVALGAVAIVAAILLTGAVMGARWIMEERAVERYAMMQALFVPNVEYYHSTHYYYDLGDVRAQDPLTIEKWYAQAGPSERLGFQPVLPRWQSGQVERAYVCVIRNMPAAIIWYDWNGVKVALHVQKRNDALTPYLVDLRKDVFKQAVTTEGLTMAAWRVADLDYVLVVPEAQAPFVFRQVF